jgi:hypothetical protein
MAETSASQNNTAIKFKGKAGHEMNRLPKPIRKAHKRGLISPKQLAKIGGDA